MLLELDGVAKSFTTPREVEVLEDVDLALGARELVCVSGAVGGGKSTLLRLAAGELVADRGRVSVLGHDVARLRRSSIQAMRQRVSWIPQELRLIDDLSAEGNVAVAGTAAGLSKRDARAASIAILAGLGLAAEVNDPVTTLSTGQRRRVSLARALVTEPRLVLADEPTGDLDNAGVEAVIEALGASVRAGAGALVTTHDERLIEAIVDRGWRHLHLVCGRLWSHDGNVANDVEEQSGVVVQFPRSGIFGGIE